MTTREKIISLLDKCADPDGNFGIDNAIVFYQRVRDEELEEAAKVCDEIDMLGAYQSAMQKIREAFEKRFGEGCWDYHGTELQLVFTEGFEAGYMAVLNELELVPNGDPDEVFLPCTLYRLPEGVEK